MTTQTDDRDPAAAARAISPEVLHVLFEQYVNAGDIENLMVLYEPEANLIDRDGKLAVGAQAIREYLQGLLSLNPHVSLHHRRTISAGTIAIVISDWTLTGAVPEGTSIADEGRTYDVVRQQADGTWRVVADNPWGKIE